jgi:hypothetical protein
VTAPQQALLSALAPYNTAVNSGDAKAVAAAAPKAATAVQNYIAQISALKAPTAAAAAAQQKFISLLKQEVALADQIGKAASANDPNTVKAVVAKIKANEALLTAAHMELLDALPS